MANDDTMPRAWNEPGKGGNKDPWGRNSSNDSPPDLEQIFKKFQERLRKIFGGRGGNNSFSSGGGSFYKKGFPLLLGIAIVCYGIFGFYIVQPYEQGIVTRFGRYDRTVLEGPHWLPRFIEKVQIINTEKLNSSRHSGWMLTKDENILFVEVEVQYRVLNSEKYLFNILSPDAALRQAADSALRQIVGESLTEDILTDKKLQISEKIKQQLVKTLELYDSGFYIDVVNFKDSRPPEAVKDAFDDVTKSREDKERVILQAEAYYNKLIPEAEGKAAQIVLAAEGYKESVILAAKGAADKFNLILPEYKLAPKVTKARLYIDAMEKVLSNTSKVLIDVNAGNIVYLPLDQLRLNKSSSYGDSDNQKVTSKIAEQPSYAPLISPKANDRRRRG